MLTVLSCAGDVRPPFSVKTVDRSLTPTLVAVLFDFLERTGISNVVGGVVGLWLDLCGAVLLTLISHVLL